VEKGLVRSKGGGGCWLVQFTVFKIQGIRVVLAAITGSGCNFTSSQWLLH
jgi:hypothetical protein